MRRTLYILLLLLLPLAALVAQERKLQNRPYIDYRRFHYGFYVGLHMQDLELANNNFVTADGEQWYADVDTYTPGFTVGVLADLRLNDFVALRLLPAMYFGDKRVVFRELNSGKIERQQIKSTYIAVPIQAKITAERFNNYRPYVVAGLSPMFDLTIKKQRPLLVKSFDCMVEVGLGCDFYLPFFKLNPELKFSFSFIDILQKERNDLLDANYLKFTQSVDRVASKMITLSLYFE